LTNDSEGNDAIASSSEGNVAIVEPSQIINKPDEFVMNSRQCVLSLRDAGDFNKIINNKNKSTQSIDARMRAINFPRERKFVVDNTIPHDFEIPKKDPSSPERSLASRLIAFA